MTLKMINRIDSSSEVKGTIDRINELKAKTKNDRDVQLESKSDSSDSGDNEDNEE